jgi:hypothetical protein
MAVSKNLKTHGGPAFLRDIYRKKPLFILASIASHVIRLGIVPC